MPHRNDGGFLRRLWWRGTPGGRLGAVCLAVLVSLGVTGFVLIPGKNTASPGGTGAPAPSTPPEAGSSAVTVHSVSAVNFFNGLEQATGQFVRVHVTGVRAIAPCWAGDALEFARTTLVGKKIWLVAQQDGQAGPDGVPAKVLLPSGEDYAHALVAAGAALADGDQLGSAEADARRNRRGVWSCSPSVPTTGTSTTTPAPTSTTATSPNTTQPPVVEPTTTTTTTSQPPDDVQRNVILGTVCAPQGARGITVKGQEARCKRKHGTEELRWARA